ncbi:MAG: hypothetical protein WCS43_07060 [Verrucomicrobiota bacterium]
MKRYILILPLVVAPLIFGSCAPTEYHSVTLYEYSKSKPKVHTSDNPREFTPVQGF